MDVPQPAVPSGSLAGWQETDATIDKAFSTPVVTVYTHTVVFEEAETRERIREETGLDFPWQFFFSSRIRLDPRKQPSPVLTRLVRRKAAAGFTARLADRGFERVTERHREEAQVGSADGLRIHYRGVIRHMLDANPDSKQTECDGDTAVLTLPVAAMLAVWAADDDYHVAGGGYPADSPDSGPNELVDSLSNHFDPTAARTTLTELIDGCGPT